MVLGAGDRVDRYVIEGLLGTGGMGDVFRARDVRLQRSVALKILRSEHDAGSTPTPESPGATRMLREARAGAALRHANVVTVYDVGEIEQPESLRGTTFLAMELIAGKPLRKYVGDSSIPMEQRVRWLESIARALSAAHAAGLVHRDVKPENVMIDDDGTAKVLDFGVARHTGVAIDPASTTESLRVASIATWGSAVGTPAYMSPEQLRNEPLDGRADQFAWGVTAYELLCGERPWIASGNVLQLVSDILSMAPTPLSQRCPDVPSTVAAVVDRALAKGREERFGSMDELLLALRRPRRRPAMLVAVLAVSVAAIAVLAVVWGAGAGRGLATPAVAHENMRADPPPSAVATSQPVPLAPPAASEAPTKGVPPHGVALSAVKPGAAGATGVARAAGTASDGRAAAAATASGGGAAASTSPTVSTPLKTPPATLDEALDRRL